MHVAKDRHGRLLLMGHQQLLCRQYVRANFEPPTFQILEALWFKGLTTACRIV